MSYQQFSGGIPTRRASEGKAQVPRSRVGLMSQQSVTHRVGMGAGPLLMHLVT
jgi:hypothetical protein